MRRLALAALFLSLPAAAEAAPRWTFCVAAARNEVWISEVFPAGEAREKIESAFRAAVERMGAAGPDAQCPEPRDDRTVALNAQFDAETFNRKMGARLHAVPAAEFPGKRGAL